MKVPIFAYAQTGGAEYIRTYRLGFPGNSDPGMGLIFDTALTPNLNRPAEIIFMRFSPNSERAIMQGKPHIIFGEIREGGYIGEADFPAKGFQELLNKEGRTADGVGRKNIRYPVSRA